MTATLTVALAATVGWLLLNGAALAPWATVLVGAVALAGALASAKMWRDNCFESRLVAVVLAVLTATGQALAATVGAPGGPPGHWHPRAVLVVVVAAAIPLLVLADTRSRARSGAGRQEPPYAL